MKLYTHWSASQHRDRHAGRNWRDTSLTDSLYYAHRHTLYTLKTYPSSLHYHDYYELVVYLRGKIHYLCEGEWFAPGPGDAILIPPGKMHMSMLDGEETRYERHVFYLTPEAFKNFPSLTAFLDASAPMMVAHLPEEALSLLPRLNEATQGGERERALALGLAMQFFYTLGSLRFRQAAQTARLPETVLQIQRYIDQHFASIDSVSDIAAHFYYSREYVSRLFRKHLNTAPADYLMKRRVAHAQGLIARGVPIADACFQSGFRDLSTFIRAFKRITGQRPSDCKPH